MTVASEGSKLLRASEVARRLGFSKQHVYTLAASGELPSIKFRRGVRFDPADVERFIKAHRRGAASSKGAA